MAEIAITDVAEFIRLSKENLLTLCANLQELGYRFAQKEGPIALAGDNDRRLLDDVASQFGQLPTLFRAWYETFCYVDFSQDEQQLRGDPPGPLSGLGYNGVLVFRDVPYSLQMREMLRRQSVKVDIGTPSRHLFPTGAIASNCAPKGVWLPDDAIDPELYNDGGGPVTFATELREAFRCGGFPFWERMFKRRRFASPIDFFPSYPQLRDKLLRNLFLF